ncbi:IS3 family transposase [Streptomyces sp. NPDC006367]|uniref:IS3 family transposase n=1 Tax=unclassified Streptomyces TaxID=2593676 RepID=UPI0033B9B6EF
MLIKTEGLRGRTFATRAEANLALFEYVDRFYNSRRIQKHLGHLSPVEFEEQHYAEQAAAERANLKPRQTRPEQLISRSRATGNLSRPCCAKSRPDRQHQLKISTDEPPSRSTADHAKRPTGKPQPSACINCSRPDQHDHVLRRSLESTLA